MSPSCIKHLRLLKQFLISLAAVRKGLTPPTFKPETVSLAPGLSLDTETVGHHHHRLLRPQQVGLSSANERFSTEISNQQTEEARQRMKLEEEELDDDTFGNYCYCSPYIQT